MNKKLYRFILSFFLVITAGASPGFSIEKFTGRKVGFMVIAPDRGFMGNQEIEEIYDQFRKHYPASLVWVGRNYNGLNGEYSAYIQNAVESLQESGVSDIVAIPLFLSQADPVLKKVVAYLPAYRSQREIRLASAMSGSYLTAQILLDRAKAESKNPEEEHLVVLGIGAMDEVDEQEMRADFSALVDYVKQYLAFKTIEVGIYYDRHANTSLKETKNQSVDDLVIRTAAKKGRTIVVPFYIGPRFDHQMSLTHWLSRKFDAYDLSFVAHELVPHANVLIWLKKTANYYVSPEPEQVGVVIMPHGATKPYNDVIDEVIAPLKTRYRIEMAYGMGDAHLIHQAVSRLESKGVRRIIFIRMYSLKDQMKARTDYILGLSDAPPKLGNKGKTPPDQLRSAALFSTFGGYEEGPDIAWVLHERVLALSRNPSEETVILVAHGSGDDRVDLRWRKVLDGHANRLRDLLKFKFQDIQTATVREDWPEKRETAVNDLKHMIESAKQKGRVLLISNRLYGAGPYEHFLEEVGLKRGEDYELNGQGFAPHPIMTQWLSSGIEQAIEGFKRETLHMASAQANSPALSGTD